MAWYPLEVFARVDFDEDLTYDELYEVEEELSAYLQEHFVILGAEHVDFFPVGDGIRIHFLMRENLILPIKKACIEIQPMLKQKTRMKFMVIDRDLTKVYSCSISSHAFEEKLFAPFKKSNAH